MFERAVMFESKEIALMDRRRHTRFDLNKACHIHHAESLCCLKNISMGGFACTCTGKKECNKELLTKANILCKEYNVALSDIEMKVVDSTVIPGAFLNCLGIRECRFKFANLKDTQVKKLEKIIVDSSFN